jgi:hypothetical protein
MTSQAIRGPSRSAHSGSYDMSTPRGNPDRHFSLAATRGEPNHDGMAWPADLPLPAQPVLPYNHVTRQFLAGFMPALQREPNRKFNIRELMALSNLLEIGQWAYATTPYTNFNSQMNRCLRRAHANGWTLPFEKLVERHNVFYRLRPSA